MKKYTIGRSGFDLLRRSLLILSILGSAVYGQNALGAGASYSDSTGGGSSDDMRAKANVYFKQGERYQKQENYKMAEEQYRLAVKTDSSYAEAFSNLGYSLRKQGNYEEAVKQYKKAIELNYRLAEAHEYLGEAYAELREFNLAENELRVLRDINSDEAHELDEFIQKMKRE